MYFPVLAACVGFGCWHVETAHWQIIVCCQATLQNSCAAPICWRYLPSTLLHLSLQFACSLMAGKQTGFFYLHILGNLSPKIHVLDVCCVCVLRLTKEGTSCNRGTLNKQGQSFLCGTVLSLLTTRFIGSYSVMELHMGMAGTPQYRLLLT